jgi:uncharacterized protein YcfJ
MNKTTILTLWTSSLLAMAVLTACSKQELAPAAEGGNPAQAALVTPAPQAPVAVAPAPPPAVCASCGVVRSITVIAQEGQGTGVGAALGAIVGGVAGNQVGGGSGRKIATVAGAVGGALLGNNIEKNRNAVTYYEVAIDMEDGSRQLITVPDTGGLAVGTAVSVQGDIINLR